MKPTIEQKLNLLKLARGLISLPADYDHFDMDSYNSEGEGAFGLKKKDYHNCGTSACAAGHGPMFGIRAKEDEYWDDYCDRVFGTINTSSQGSWDYLFSSLWHGEHGTPLAAAQRIVTFLENDCETPSGWSYNQ